MIKGLTNAKTKLFSDDKKKDFITKKRGNKMLQLFFFNPGKTYKMIQK